MNESHDFRVELLLIIPVVWIIFDLLPDDIEIQSERALGEAAQWQMSQINILPEYQSQKDVLISLYELKNIPVNQADAELLATVPGIGPALAGRIVAERLRLGSFHEPGDLTRVHGIGQRRARQFQRYLRFD